MFLVFDTETTGLPQNFSAPLSDSDNWPRMVQIAWQLHDDMGVLIDNQDYIIKPEGYDIPFSVTKIHGISTQMAMEQGRDLAEVLAEFEQLLQENTILAGHNIKFDVNIIGAEMYRKKLDSKIVKLPCVDTANEGKDVTRLAGGRGGQFKFPKLAELYTHLFAQGFDEAHNAAADVNATARCFFELVRLGAIEAPKLGFEAEQMERFLLQNPHTFQPFAIAVRAQVQASKKKESVVQQDFQNIDLGSYFHFHNHSIFSILQSTTHFSDVIQSAVANNFEAVAMIDLGNMMGAFKFINEVESHNKKIKEAQKSLADGASTDAKIQTLAQQNILIPILGCEVYLSERYQQKQFTKDDPDRRSTQLLIAKNHLGYQNLSKISSEGYVEGLYSGFPRVSKEVVLAHKENLIAVTGSLSSDVCSAILNFGEQKGEEVFQWWKAAFGTDFYVQLQNHGLDEEQYVNKVLLGFAQKYQVEILAQNETFYSKKEDASVHDIVVCIKDGEQQATPIGRGFGKRYGLTSSEYYLKNRAEIQQTFGEYPQAFAAYATFLRKFEPYSLSRPVLLPKFDIPAQFIDEKDHEDGGKRGEMAYLRHLSYEGAAKRYPNITSEISERLDFELETIAKTGYPGYFLIVQDFCNQARKMGVSVGPGRGSAAGSAVAYCTGITNVDPIKYDLLFERFLNPERISMPDIDIDFDDEGRGKIIDWVIEKYGQTQVAQIITYGTLGGKSAIKDAGRVLQYPISETTVLSNLLPGTPGFNLTKAFQSDEKKLKEKYKFDVDVIAKINQLKGYLEGNGMEHKVVESAYKMEGGVRNTGIHACGVIITPDDIRNLVPVSVAAKDSKLLVSQFDNSVVEDAGLLKMDFLGLKTLTIIKNAIEMIKKGHEIDIDIDAIPLDDVKTYELFKEGKTVGIFQYESAGMQKHLRDLQPDKFEDLIAMNALYRPGPIKYIPDYIARKHNPQKVAYDLPEMEEFLADTYGITVYQEQVMLLSQKLANFTKGEADTLRKAMGKKIKAVLDKMQPKFLAGGIKNGLDETKLNKVWKDWEAFAEYAFNKSHSTCYALIAYQTAYLKANYPAEFMAAVLNNTKNIDAVSFFMEECKNINVPVLGPDVNESELRFTVNKKGEIRFGLSFMKGLGEKAVANVIDERNHNGLYKDIYDFAQRNARTSVNKKAYENFVMSGSFDLFEYHRAQYLYLASGDKTNQVERLMKYGVDFHNQKETLQTSLFGGTSDMEIGKPVFQDVAEWPLLEKLAYEKLTIGIFLTGHPLDMFKLEMDLFCSHTLEDINKVMNRNYGNNNDNLSENQDDVEGMDSGDTVEDMKNNLENMLNREITIGGIITKKEEKQTKTGKPYGIITMVDFTNTTEFRFFSNDYINIRSALGKDFFVQIKGKFQKRFGAEDNWDFKPLSVVLLSELRGAHINSITLNLSILDVSTEVIEGLDAIFQDNQVKHEKKSCRVYVNVYDQENSVQLNLMSKNTHIYPDNDFIKEVEKLIGDELKFN